MKKNTSKTSISKDKTQQIIRLRKTKELFQKEFVLHSDIASLSPNAFSGFSEVTIQVLEYLFNCKYALIWQSQINMAKNMGLGREEVNRALRVLRKFGLVDWFQRHNNSNVYRLHDIVYTYQFRQSYKHLFQGLSHPSFYALVPTFLWGIKDKITLILKNYLYKNNFNYKEWYISWHNRPRNNHQGGNVRFLLQSILTKGMLEANQAPNVPFKGKKRKEHSYFPTPRSAPPPSHILESIEDIDLRKALQAYWDRGQIHEEGQSSTRELASNKQGYIF